VSTGGDAGGTSGDAASRASIGGGATVMAGGTLVSRVLGMVRAIVLIAVIGTGSQAANAFQLANVLPNTMYNLLVSGVLSAVLVPQVVRAYKRSTGQEYVDRLLTLGFLVLAALALVLTAAVPLITRLFGSGHSGARLDLAIAFGYWCMPQVFFYGVYALLGQVLNARGSFGPFTWAPVANNVVAIAMLGVFAVLYGAQNEHVWPADQWTSHQIAVLAGGATLGIVAQAGVLIFAMRRAGVGYRPRWGLRGVGLGTAGNVAVWTFVALLIGQAGTIAVTQAASAASDAAGRDVLVAGYNAYQLAFTIFMLPHSLVTVSLVTALFPRLSAQAADRAHGAVGTTVSLGLRVVGLFTIPAAAFGVLFAQPLVRALLPSTEQVAVPVLGQVVVAMMIGLPAFGTWSVCQRVYYAYEDARGLVPVAIGMASVVVLGTVAVRLVLPPSMWVVGAALAMSGSYLLASAMALVGLMRRVGHLGGRAVLRVHVRGTLAALVAAVAGAAVIFAAGLVGLHPSGGVLGWIKAIVLCVLGGGVIGFVYWAVLRALHVNELDLLLDSVRRMVGRLRRRPAV
jgi:putative peptidoglycan lipid II flippase